MNLLTILCSYVVIAIENGNQCKNIANKSFSKLFKDNGFAKECFGKKYEQEKGENIVPFRIFDASKTNEFGEYIDQELIKFFPSMLQNVKKQISNNIQELFGNAHVHASCNRVYTCGQNYTYNHKMDFTIVNLGVTIKENVDKFLLEKNINSDYNSAIEWAVVMGNSTKKETSGGLGLSLMKKFITNNKGKFQIISDNEYWELNNEKIISNKMNITFPGTIINIEIDQYDKAIYALNDDNSILDIRDLF